MFNRADYSFIVKYGNLTPDGVAVYDLNTRKFVYLNRFFTAMFQVDEEALKEDPGKILSSVHPEDLAFLENRYRELLSIGCIAETEFRLQPNKDDMRYVTAEVLWVEDSYTFAIFVRDITLLHQHDEQVLKFTAKKDSLLDMLVHNLSGPLYLSRDVLKVLSETGNGKQEAERLISLISRNTEACLEIVNDFLLEEHTESLRTFVKRSRFSLPEKINLMLELLREMNPAKSFAMHLPEEPLNVYSDPVKFCQVMQNILSNAVKYTRDNGRIDISIVRIDSGYRIAVKDDGIGIPEQLKPKLFSERIQGMPGLKGEKSHGMGLFLVKQLLELLNGRVSIESSEQDGTTVHVEVPEEGMWNSYHT